MEKGTVKVISQPSNSYYCGIKRHYWIRALAVVAIVIFIIYMKFTLYIPGRNDSYHIINLDYRQIIESSTEISKTLNDTSEIINSTVSANSNNESATYKSEDVTEAIFDDSDEFSNETSDDQFTNDTDDTDETRLKYILQWTAGNLSPFYHMGQGQERFFKFNCPFTNCYVTDNHTLFKSLKDFDAIVFNGNYVIKMNQDQLPQERSPTQKYVFGGTEPAAMNLACKPVLDSFFNWTWTYRIDSDFRWGYVTVFDLNGTPVGPKPNMVWPEEMEPISDEVKKILDGKSKAAAWFVSRCRAPSRREDVARKVSKELEKFGMSVDIYGCGKFKCPRSIAEQCFKKVETDYYFYFSFENSFSADYVTEKLLTALNNYAIPVVYGGANYTRFLPPGSYLNARELDAKQLAETMNEIINNKTRYYDFFRWRNHFKYKETTDSEDICNICTALNDKEKVKTVSIHEHFREWWNDQWHDTCSRSRYH